MAETMGAAVDDEFWSKMTAGAAPNELSAAERERQRRSQALTNRLAAQEAANVVVLSHARRLRRRRAIRRWFLGGALAASIALAVSVIEPSSAGDPGPFVESPGIDRPPPGVDASPRPLLPAPDASGLVGDYVLLDPSLNHGAVTAWDACRPIRWTMNEASAPDGAVDLVHEAVAVVSAESGYVFEYSGPTDEMYSPDRAAYQPDRYGKRWAPVLVSWAPAATVAEFDDATAGIGGPATVTTNWGRSVHVSGSVTIKLESYREMAAGGPNPQWGRNANRAVLIHEFLHVLGLGHTEDRNQLMHAENSGLIALGDGDRRGLAALRSTDCAPEV